MRIDNYENNPELISVLVQQTFKKKVVCSALCLEKTISSTLLVYM